MGDLAVMRTEGPDGDPDRPDLRVSVDGRWTATGAPNGRFARLPNLRLSSRSATIRRESVRGLRPALRSG